MWLCLYLHLCGCNEVMLFLLGVKYVYPSQPGFVFALGEGDTGQLGLGPDVIDRTKPAPVPLPTGAIQICAGGMHSVCLTVGGEVSCSLSIICTN